MKAWNGRKMSHGGRKLKLERPKATQRIPKPAPKPKKK